MTTATDTYYGISGTSRPYFYCSISTFIKAMLPPIQVSYASLCIPGYNLFTQLVLNYKNILFNYMHAYIYYKGKNSIFYEYVEVSVKMVQAQQHTRRVMRSLIFSFKKRAYTLTYSSYYAGAIFTYSTGMFVPKNIKFFRSKSRRKQILTYLRSLKKKKRKQERKKLGLIR